MNEYMDNTHPDAFVDWPTMIPQHGMTRVCPKCKGHGGWNLRMHAYPLPAGVADTPQTRHSYAHFRQSCGHCNGWGYVSPDETCTGHEWENPVSMGRCLTRYTCSKCGQVREFDSSD